MNMQPLDILYTPLDTPDVPDVPYSDIKDWAATASFNAKEDSSKIFGKDYPWLLGYARYDSKWIQGFDTRFKVLCDYVLDTFQLQEKWLQGLVFLPVRQDFIGTSFWHSDHDTIGLRFYLENDTPENAMLMRSFTEPYVERPTWDIPHDGIEPRIKTATHRLEMPKLKQVFYINNARAVHAVQVEKLNSKRVAVIISVHKATLVRMPKYVRELIVNSAENHPQERLLWEPQP